MDGLSELSLEDLQRRLHWLDIKYQHDQEELAVLYQGCKSALEAAARELTK